ncbi:DUF3515 domain-containing protein [Streptomyces sp. NPDC018031]|uniref:DUF3515 domain-containing protein n=1 Tax=Streptomyces sp. NPDC018031 TaxID=3365033 RepID=UPI00379FA54B
MNFSSRRLISLAAAALVLVPAAGCTSTDEAAGPAVPTPPAKAVAMCRALHRELPRQLDGLDRRETDPASDFTAAWGDPAVELRCGVPQPDVLTPGSEAYNALPDSAELNGVGWVIEKQDGGYRFTTTLRRAYVEVVVPDDYAPEVNVLIDLAGAVRKTVPAGI